MTGLAPAPGRPETGDAAVPSITGDARRATPVAARGGLLAFAAAIVLGQAPPLAMNLFGAGMAVTTQVRLGWLYTVASNAVGLRIEGFVEADDGLVSFQTASLRISLLTLTFVLAWLLFRAGSAAARRVSDVPGRRAAAGALVGPFYAIPLGLLSLLVELRLHTDGGFLPDVLAFRAIVWESFVFTLVLGTVAGAAGGLAAGGGVHGRLADAVAGGWRAFAVALALALVGGLVYAALRPSGVEGYVEELRSLGRKGAALTVGHQLALAPNHAVLTLVPSMGACDSVRTTNDGDRRTDDVLCLDRQPSGDNPLEALFAGLNDQAAVTRPLPDVAKLFLLVPFMAVTIGAWRAAASAWSGSDALVRGLSAGAVFAALVMVAAWTSTVSLHVVQVLVEDRRSASVSLGADPLRAGALALAWGTVVGACAGWSRFAARGRAKEPAEDQAEDPAEDQAEDQAEDPAGGPTN